MTNIIDIARLIDPAAWAEADEYAAMTSVAPEGMKIFFDQRVMRIVTPSIEAAQRVVNGLQSMASADPEPTAPSSPTLKKIRPAQEIADHPVEPRPANPGRTCLTAITQGE